MVCGNIFELRAHVFCVFPPFLVVFWHTLLAGAMLWFLGHHSTFHHSPVLHNPSAEPCTIFFPLCRGGLSSFVPRLVAESSPCKDLPGGALWV